MSVEFNYLKIKLAGQRKYGLTDTECKVGEAVFILSRYGKGWCTAKRKSMGEAINSAESTVGHALTKLERLGLIERTKGGSIRTTSRYDFDFPASEVDLPKSADLPEMATNPAENGSPTLPKSATEEELEEEQKNISSRPSGLERFEEFWEAFKDKRARPSAEKVWKRKELDNIAGEVIAGAKRYVVDRGPDQKYWKMPQGWLNDERWKDTSKVLSRSLNLEEQFRKRYEYYAQAERDYGREPETLESYLNRHRC